MATCNEGWRSSSSKVPSPWVALEARADLNLIRLPIPEPGRYYDDERTIVMRTGLLIVEERRYLWHELVHADRRDIACHACEHVEASVEREAARRAMPWRSLEWASRIAECRAEMAELLKLPEDWVAFRLSILHPAERASWRNLSEAAASIGAC